MLDCKTRVVSKMIDVMHPQHGHFVECSHGDQLYMTKHPLPIKQGNLDNTDP